MKGETQRFRKSVLLASMLAAFAGAEAATVTDPVTGSGDAYGSAVKTCDGAVCTYDFGETVTISADRSDFETEKAFFGEFANGVVRFIGTSKNKLTGSEITIANPVTIEATDVAQEGDSSSDELFGVYFNYANGNALTFKDALTINATLERDSSRSLATANGINVRGANAKGNTINAGDTTISVDVSSLLSGAQARGIYTWTGDNGNSMTFGDLVIQVSADSEGGVANAYGLYGGGLSLTASSLRIEANSNTSAARNATAHGLYALKYSDIAVNGTLSISAEAESGGSNATTTGLWVYGGSVSVTGGSASDITAVASSSAGKATARGIYVYTSGSELNLSSESSQIVTVRSEAVNTGGVAKSYGVDLYGAGFTFEGSLNITSTADSSTGDGTAYGLNATTQTAVIRTALNINAEGDEAYAVHAYRGVTQGSVTAGSVTLSAVGTAEACGVCLEGGAADFASGSISASSAAADATVTAVSVSETGAFEMGSEGSAVTIIA
ncbi:hypothetical protein [Sutterella sp.]|uniref:hypothetical protein n=1 Tax=Sutterella sp. TaxID=1981025 RepID=UPI0026DF7863|nr:hypothetical protein [Sutterella sp.]MDO5530784.1 hypothetical protein [Sutterella sp.]